MKEALAMGYAIAFFAVFARLFRPSQGVHTSAFGYLRELVSETSALRRRSSRVRRYATDLPTVAELPELPRIAPEPRATLRDVPADYLPVVDPREVAEPAHIVRPYYLDYERRREQDYADRQRLGVAVLLDVANAANRDEVSV